ncbi:triacylglycerol lipase [Thelephora terrestris]|uniref:Triacylglycerol lipase n=1 Tax=Thelephora terrestris TaxID=56493 RepID=A0A9P6HRB2_9AGAM|nr:triacylglycerol lipase [Thelephora terrestris]
MAYIPLIGRLTLREYFAVFFGFVFLGIEMLVRLVITIILPRPVVNWFYRRSRTLYKFARNPVDKNRDSHHDPARVTRIRTAADFGELCSIWGYEFEEHVMLTKDGYLLGLHRLCTPHGAQRAPIGSQINQPVVYLHHGLLMNSEIWICLTSPNRALPFVLVDLGFDVWLGNNRGNKYSKKSIRHDPNSKEFWNYSMDDFAWHDIPDSINYVLDVTRAKSLSYIGFSQGSAQAFAALSIHPQLNPKVNVFIALAPAMSPTGLAAPVVDGLMKASPTLMYLIFGRKAILSSTPFWNNIIYPPLFTNGIDKCLDFLFNWKSANITTEQKSAAYSHLYSFTSTKSVVHWFQIMRCGRFIMYDDDGLEVSVSHRRDGSRVSSGPTAYCPARFPTKNISSPIVLLYGDSDSLVDIKLMSKQLPANCKAIPLEGYEHLDVIWGKSVEEDVIPKVLEILIRHCESSPRVDMHVRNSSRKWEEEISTNISSSD